MLRHVEIMENGTGGNHTVRDFIYTKSFEVLCLKLFGETIIGCLCCKHPVVQCVGEKLLPKGGLKVISMIAFKEYFFGSKVIEQFIDVVAISFGCKKFAC